MDASTLGNFADTILVSRYCSICGLTMCLADIGEFNNFRVPHFGLTSYVLIVNTLPREVRYYWGTPWNLPKALYFYVRRLATPHFSSTLKSVIDRCDIPPLSSNCC